MNIYEYSRDVKSVGKYYLLTSVIGIPITVFLFAGADQIFSVFAKYILLGMFVLLALCGLIYAPVKGRWYFKIDGSHFEYVSPFGKTKCFKVPIAEIEKLEVQQSNAPDAVYYYLHLRDKRKYQLDTDSLVSMKRIKSCLQEASVEIQYSSGG